jgi:acetyl esterase/lipase
MLCDSAEFTPRGGREWLTALFLRSVVRIAVKPVLSPKVSIPLQRWWLKRLTALIRPGHRVKIQDGVLGGVKGEWVRSTRTTTNTGQSAAILYLHGGGYCVGSPATHRAVTARLARTTGLPVFVADYRLAPEYPFPAAVDDAVAAYRALLEMGQVVVAGDSAGGGLALATALAARQLQLNLPAALILFSPWVDLTTSTLSDAAKHEAVLSRAWLATCAGHYLADGDPNAPLASPIYGDLRGLPPTLIQAGVDELLHGDAVRIHDALLNAGVPVRCEIIAALWHGFHLHAGMLPAANAAIERVGRFISCSFAPPVLDPVR